MWRRREAATRPSVVGRLGSDYDKDAWHRIRVAAGTWPASAANKPARPVRLEVVLRWVRMKYPDGVSFDEYGNDLIGVQGFGWLPRPKEAEQERPKRKYQRRERDVIVLDFERRLRRRGVA